MVDVYEKYFDWLCNKVGATKDKGRLGHEKLLRYFYYRPYRYSLRMDQNRYVDGINLRYRFADEAGISQAIIASTLDGKECNMLEMMVALDERCILMEYARPGDHFGEIFWQMVNGMGLLNMVDSRMNPTKVDNAIQIVENRTYNPDGSGGGLFQLQRPRDDLRNVDIWYQAMWFISENSNSEV